MRLRPQQGTPEPVFRGQPIPLFRGTIEGACCKDCPFSKAGQPRRPVVGEGPANPDWIIIGEGPGQTEIALGRPFVGASGGLVNKALDAIGCPRNKIWISNVTLCLPTPDAGDEDKHRARKCCEPRFMVEMARHPGKPVLALGAIAAQAFLGSGIGISEISGSYHQVDRDGTGLRVVIPTLHPAAILRGGAGVGGAHAPDLAFWNLMYDAAKINSIAAGKDIVFREDDVYTEWQDPKRAEELIRAIVQEARRERMVAVDTETYVDDERRHSALQPLNAKLSAIGLATTNWGMSVAWNIVTPMGHRLLAAVMADPNVRTVMHNRLYDRPVLRRHRMPVFGPCDDCYLDAETEFLTKDGWKAYTDIGKDVDLATIRSDGTFEWQRPFDRISKPYKGAVLTFETKHTRAVVTPNHRMWCQPVRRSARTWQGRAIGPWQFVRAEDTLAGESFLIQQTCRRPVDESTVPEEGDRLRLLGLWISDGSLMWRRDKLTGITISQQQDGQATSLLQSLRKRFDLTTSQAVHHEEWRKQPCVEVTWRLNDKTTAEKFMCDCGRYSKQRRLPHWVWTLSVSAKEALLDGLFAGDSTILHGPHNRVIYRTCSSWLADDVQALALSIGWTASSPPSRREDNMRYVYILRQVSADVQIRTRLAGRNARVKKSQVAGRIVCFSVPNETLITRSRGKPAFYGNTMLKHHNAFPGLAHGLQRVATQYFAIAPWKSEFRHGKDTIENLTTYNGRDTLVTARLDEPLDVAMEHTRSRRTYEIDLLCADAAEWMYDVGIPISREVNQKLYDQFWVNMQEARKGIEGKANEPEIREKLWDRLAFEQAKRYRRGSQTRPDSENYGDRQIMRLEEIRKAHAADKWEWKIGSADHLGPLLQIHGLQLDTTPKGKLQITLDVLKPHRDDSIIEALYEYRKDRKNEAAKKVVEDEAARLDIRDELWKGIAFEQAKRIRQPSGTPADPEDFEDRQKVRLKEIEEAYKKGDWFWKIGSSDHIAAYLKARGVPMYFQTDKGATSTKKEVLEGFAHLPEVRSLIDFRENQKMFSTFVYSFFDRHDEEGKLVKCGHAVQYGPEEYRLHPRWNVHRITGRWSAEDPQCFDGKTEILTEEGWIRFGELPDDVRVAQYWKESGQIDFTQPTSHVDLQHPGEMIHITNRYVDLLVTSDHGLLIQKRSGDLRDVQAGEYRPEGHDHFFHAGEFVFGIDILSSALVTLLCATQADGTPNNSGIDFQFTKERKIERLCQALDTLGVPYSRKERTVPNPFKLGAMRRRVRIYAFQSAAVTRVRELLGPKKKFGAWLLSFDVMTVEQILSEVVFWDGLYGGKQYYSSVETNADWIQTLSSLRGRRAVIHRYTGSPIQTKPNYQVRYADRAYSSASAMSFVRVPWKSRVYCVNVPSHYIVVRRNKKVVITKNCQNWPKADKKKGRPNLRSQVVAPDGRILVGFDFAQLEARIIALLSGDPFLYDIFNSGKDIHSEFARIVWPNYDELPYERRKVLRDSIKRPEYGAFFGGSVETLWQNIKKDYPDVQLADIARMVSLMTAKMPGVTIWHQQLLREVAKPPHEIRSAIYGRRRCFPLGNADINDVYNFPVQCGRYDQHVLTTAGHVAYQDLDPERHALIQPSGRATTAFTLHDSGLRTVYEVRTEQHTVVCTAGHRFLPSKPDGSAVLWKPLRELRWGEHGSRIASNYSSKNRRFERVVDVIKEPGKAQTFDLEIHSDDHGYMLEGLVTHNSTGADIMATGLILLMPKLRRDYHNAAPIIQIHDAIVFECDEGEEVRLQKDVQECFEQTHTHNDVTIHFPVDPATGRSWTDV